MTFTEPHINMKYKILKTIILKILRKKEKKKGSWRCEIGIFRERNVVISSLKTCMIMFIFKEWKTLNGHCKKDEQGHDWDLFPILLVVSAWSFGILTSLLPVTKITSPFLTLLRFPRTLPVCKFIQMVCLWPVYHIFAVVLLRQKCLCIKTTFVSNLRVP